MSAVLLIAQMLAAAHYHHPNGATGFSASATASFDNGLCALCLFHYYSPTVAVATPMPIPPAVVEHNDLYAAQSWPLYSFNSYLSGRAPPLS